MHDDYERLLRFLEGDLSDAEARALGARLEREPELRARVERMRLLRSALAESAADAFAPHFSDRVLRRLAPAEEASAESLYDALRWVFARTAVAGVVAAGALGALNVLDYGGLGVAVSTVEVLFGLPSATLADALIYSAL